MKNVYSKNTDKNVNIIDSISKRILDNRSLDEEREKQRVKDLRIKQKLKRRKLNPREEQDDEQIAVIGSSGE